MPLLAMIEISLPKMYPKPSRMKRSATNAVPESFWMFRIMARAGIFSWEGPRHGLKVRTEEYDELDED